MIYQLGQISNRDTQVLYFYRILRHSATDLSAICRYDNPDVYQLSSPISNTIDDGIVYEYRLDCKPTANRIPYLEFSSEIEKDLENIADLYELEVKTDSLILRSHRDNNLENLTVAVYWVPSLAYIQKIQNDILNRLKELKSRATLDNELISQITVNSNYVLNLEGKVPNLVNIGKDSSGLIYDDSGYQLSGSLDTQTLINPPQSLISSLLKSHIGTLTIYHTTTGSRVYQGFYGGCLELSGKFSTLVLKDITSIIFLDDIIADTIIIENCPAVIFRKDIDDEGASQSVGRLEVRNSYLTINQAITIEDIWCYRRSTVVFIKGIIHTIGFIEAGSDLTYVEPSNTTKIEEIRSSTLQGLFYTSNPPEDEPYLDEIFLAQKPISFQRGQVDDPVPISQANVSIYLKHSSGPEPGPGPGPSPGDKIYSPFTDWYWSGDSRTVGIINATGTDGKGYVGEALAKLQQVQTEIETEGTQHNIILWWGVNGLDDGASNYADVYRAIANTVGSTAMVFVGTVGHCPDGTGSGKVDGGGGQSLGPFNEAIAQFNTDLKAALANVANIHILDIDAYITELENDRGPAWLTNDNLHYKPEACQMIYDWVCDQITNVDPGNIPDAPTDTNAGRIWNWFKYANIPNVSNRPELIAGIIGNCQQESYGAIDLLGNNGTYYGPWCESQVGFRNTVTAAGFTFHPYTASPGDDSAAIPTIFNWLTQQDGSWVNWLALVIDQVSSQTGEAGARAFAELFCVCIERCIGGSDAVLDSGVYQIMINEYGGTVYLYQDLGTRRDNAAAIYHRFMGI